VTISRGQAASEDSLVKQANKVFFTDTDGLITTIYSDLVLGEIPREVQERAENRKYDLYLLTDVDVPWVDDGQRLFPHRRTEFFKRCEAMLRERGRPYVRISGSWEERKQKAIAAVDELLYGQQKGEVAA
jgi:NadR type nicotinamide-nucleotide adenylyltransferase